MAKLGHHTNIRVQYNCKWVILAQCPWKVNHVFYTKRLVEKNIYFSLYCLYTMIAEYLLSAIFFTFFVFCFCYPLFRLWYLHVEDVCRTYRMFADFQLQYYDENTNSLLTSTEKEKNFTNMEDVFVLLVFPVDIFIVLSLLLPYRHLGEIEFSISNY